MKPKAKVEKGQTLARKPGEISPEEIDTVVRDAAADAQLKGEPIHGVSIILVFKGGNTAVVGLRSPSETPNEVANLLASHQMAINAIMKSVEEEHGPVAAMGIALSVKQAVKAQGKALDGDDDAAGDEKAAAKPFGFGVDVPNDLMDAIPDGIKWN